MRYWRSSVPTVSAFDEAVSGIFDLSRQTSIEASLCQDAAPGCPGACALIVIFLPGSVEGPRLRLGSGMTGQDVEPVTLDSGSFLFHPPGPT